MAMNDEVKPQPKTYWVTGASPVLEHEPGEEFEAALDPEQEAFYLAGGHLSLEAPVEETEEQKPDPTGTPRGAKPTPEEKKE